ncbi:glycosyltransferase [Saccharibacillus sp. O23]|uniref:CPCC family cysteine-rich protein n=1 Tax=Saccharibacillus sp. O23 TaxID=2009338 RepID=UPI000B4E1478|nr:CPCC family cysteine-rich protein [Saccharibacillus sp. O23]OWR31429.1 glycosyltransferase [Saccharibacillus sp. O23]
MLNAERMACPCCGYFTIESDDEVIVEICEVCFWQYDFVAHKYPDRNIGANHVSLKEARENHQKFGACKASVLSHVRAPEKEELPENNQI